ncbi:hypothetical protein PACILC2_02010 [Paenibacillus cisolokensis]|uniref:DEAD/DEAH-box helicase domain-containing protein n=1 Tax=Paenibacillus cisolokensis TaxID=1658519 RepID=A0ABQ4N0D7_9BACL|nr:DEAD/DEAH box helicase [Paenibacillus cisolokensis]GIQ61633.1 hypothetical protein PACILC2_02010 [Paenibacillus cisolokensis]
MMSNTGNYNPQILRNQFIREIDESQDPTYKAEQLADKLFTLGLTMYSKNFCLDSLIYNSFALSYLDDRVSLHPEQLQIIEYISEEEGVIFSAPTSFGKTFVIFEYIARFQPDNIVLVVPTLALVDEYMKKLLSVMKRYFKITIFIYPYRKGKNITLITKTFSY